MDLLVLQIFLQSVLGKPVKNQTTAARSMAGRKIMKSPIRAIMITPITIRINAGSEFLEQGKCGNYKENYSSPKYARRGVPVRLYGLSS